MSTYVGWHQCGDVQVYDESTKKTTFHKITKVNVFKLDTLDKALDELMEIVEVAEVKQLVFVHMGFDIKICHLIVEKLTGRGFKSVYIQYWMSNRFQTLLLKQNVEFTEGQHFLLAVNEICEKLTVWRYCGGRIEFVKRGPVVGFFANGRLLGDIVRLFNKFKIELMINIKCDTISALVKKLFPKCKIVDQVGSWNSNDWTATALWTAKRQDGLVGGIEVGNMYWHGIYIHIEKENILENLDKGIPLPFSWTSDWKLCKSAMTASVTFDILITNVELPANRNCRLNVKIDRNGSTKIYVELKCILGISLSQDSFHLVRSSDFVDGKTVSIGQFPTALRFDCDPPKLASSVSGENVIADAIKMLDPKAEVNNGWKCLRTGESKVQFCKFLDGNNGPKILSASFIVGELIDNIKSLVADVCLDSEKIVFITLSRFLTKKQREKLTNILKQKFPKIEFVDEILAAAYGYSVQKEKPGGVTLVVDLRTTGCLFSLFRIEDSFCEHAEQQEHADLKSENIRQALKVIFGSQSRTIEKFDEIKSEMKKIIKNFRQAISDVVGSEQNNVNNVLLIGSCHLVPNFTEHFEWLFFSANVVFLEESELCRLAATGSV